MCINTQKRHAKRMEAGSFQWSPMQDQRQWAQLKCRRFPQHVEADFPVRVTEHWHGLPREVVGSPSMELFQSQLAMVLALP